MLSIYIHIPFCIQKCLYCDFLSAPIGEAGRESYLKALHAQIAAESVFYQNREVRTVFLGGGTPSVLSAEQTERLMAQVRSCYRLTPDAEITTELNPGTVTMEKLAGYRRAGINRLSMGLQSADNAELKLLGRMHTMEDFMVCWRMARACGFTNINVDVMSALPGQDSTSWERTLRTVCLLEQPPEHISAYSLIVEEGTPFYERYAEGRPEAVRLPDEEEDRKMYHRTKELLEEYGYSRYEISNYAKAGYHCRHNEVYWRRMDYIGLGLGAASMINNVRWHNERLMQAYVDTLLHGGSVRRDIQQLSLTEQMEEFCFLGLRLTEGISPAQFETAFSKTLDSVYGKEIDKLKRQGLLAGEESLRLTAYGTDISNYVFSQFIKD